MAEFEVEPGSYQVYVSRGTGYSLFSTAVTVSAGTNPVINAQIGRVISTMDRHHSRMADARQVFGLPPEAGQGALTRSPSVDDL